MATKKGIRLPTKIRLMSSAAYDIVTSVFRDTIPYRVRILVSDAARLFGVHRATVTRLLQRKLAA